MLKANFNQNVVINNLSNSFKFLSIIMIIFSYKTERIDMYWVLLPVILNFSIYFYSRVFSREMRLIPYGYKILIISYHILENLQICFVVLYNKDVISSIVMVIPFAILVPLIYITLIKTPLYRIRPILFFVLCGMHFICITIGSFIYYRLDIFFACSAPTLAILLQIFVYLKLRHQLHAIKIRMHLVHEKILNFEP